ncbi:MAG: xanthine dehydrogenase family protein molybdopterin-binding subunit [Pseudomonadota bacterium]
MSAELHDFERYAIGQSVSRTEDPRLLTGTGTYTADLHFDGMAYGYVLRSPYAHAHIELLDVSAARGLSGVLDVLLWADMAASDVGLLPCNNPIKSRDGTPLIKPRRPSLADGTVRYVGEPLALIVAESLAIAREAAELIELEVDELPAVTDFMEAMADGAPQLHDEAPNNVALDWEFGDADTVDTAMRGAAHVSRLVLGSNRLVINPMEPRAAIGEYVDGRYILHVGSQGVFGMRNVMARNVMNVPDEQMHVRTYDVGGSFGMKSAVYPEYGPLLLAARRLGRPVKWVDDRSDSFVSDQHGRDSEAHVEIGFDADGRIVAGRVYCYCANGGYLSPGGPSMHTGNIPRNFPGPYRLPLLYARTRAMFTNTTPIGAYRGAGRPEGVYYMERVLTQAAHELGIDAVELRLLNLIEPEALPYAAVSKLTYDSGDFPGILRDGLVHADWDGFEARRAQSESQGKLRGRGFACYMEATGAPAREMGGIRFEGDGTVTMISGSLNYGQGHAGTFAQIVSSHLGVPFERLRLIQGDSDEVIAGAGSGGSRTVISAGALLLKAADEVIDRGKQVTGFLLEADAGDIEFERGRFRIVGTDRGMTIMQVAEAFQTLDAVPAELVGGMDVRLTDDAPPSAFPNGCHVAEVEIDPETGEVAVDRYAVMDDFGTLINPMLVEGQVQGGVAQGLGQALLERTVYDEDGQLLTGSFMDYTMPRATDMPDIAFASRPIPATTNPLGAKGCGEAGTTGSLPAIMNAIVDVLKKERGIEHFDMPATPERIWRALHT